MKNIIKELGFIVATAALIFAGAANLYAADHLPSVQDQPTYERFLDIGTGGGSE